MEQVFPNPLRRFHALDLALPGHGHGTGRVFLAPNQPPRAVLAREYAMGGASVVVGRKPAGQVVGVADVEGSPRVLKNVNPIHEEKIGSIPMDRENL